MLRSISWRKLMHKFRRLGFEGPRPGSSHFLMKKGEHKVIIPDPHGGDISKGLVARMLREAGISEEEWENA